ncbi:hypothetical protein L1049_016700 [Liquidambar formosana]|uniref:Uncharacterized protein n=1 Tax=Liquidambar formosana TaxID=63359 RepID=A0AAP0X7P6_LIQFO
MLAKPIAFLYTTLRRQGETHPSCITGLATTWTNVQVDKTTSLWTEHGKVSLRSLNSLKSLAEADWKSINPPKNLNHRELRFWLSGSTGKCLTVFGGKTEKRTVGCS